MKFRCKETGNVLEFTEQGEIESMLSMPHYEVVAEVAPKKGKTAPVVEPEVIVE